MVFRCFVEKKPGFDVDAGALLSDIKSFLNIGGVSRVRIINRYDVEGIEKDLFDSITRTILSEPPQDFVYEAMPATEGKVFAVEYLPGQYDQRADSAAQCIQLVSQGNRPVVRTAKVYVVEGSVSEEELAAIKKHVVNPVESRLTDMAEKKTLAMPSDPPGPVAVLEGFIGWDEKELAALLSQMGLAMDLDDLKFCQEYFKSEKKDPTVAEIRMIDTYWSDHCRHTTFNTVIEDVTFADEIHQKAYEVFMQAREFLNRQKPVSLMELGTMGARYLKKTGDLTRLDESEEINACTVKTTVTTEHGEEEWLLLFKNETHNHPTEIEPFGGAATCIGGAIRDPLSGRAYVYQAMRVTGAADPLRPLEETIPGKLPQRKLVTTAAAGYSSYGNQIGLATGQVDEIYHDGYAAKRMEIGAVVGAAPAKNVRRETPKDGDVVILLGGRTGRDGCGGATGSSKSHNTKSLEECGAEVQKGNAPEERKLQRLFRNPEAAKLILRCNDFGAGGVSVAIGELADGLVIDLDKVPKKYEDLGGTELAISESQERMAVVVEPQDVDAFIRMAGEENLEATVVAYVQENPRLQMDWRGDRIVDVSREFLNSNGAPKRMTAVVDKAESYDKTIVDDFEKELTFLVQDLNVCSKRGLSERFDSTIGAGTVLMPFGGKEQITPAQAMAAKFPVLEGTTDDCSVMAWGFNPYIMEKSPYHGAYLSVVESVSKLIATGASMEECYLTFQEYFERLGADPHRWGKPMAALLGAFMAQKDLKVAAIGGKDSMSGSFESLHVPPTLVSFAISKAKASGLVSPEFKKAGSRVVALYPKYDENGLPTGESLLALYDKVYHMVQEGKVLSAWTPGFGGIMEGLFKMTLGNRIGLAIDASVTVPQLFCYSYGAFVLELSGDVEDKDFVLLGTTTESFRLTYKTSDMDIEKLQKLYEDKLEPVFSCNIPFEDKKIEAFTHMAESRKAPKIGMAKPKALIPVFPGTNCEYDTARRMEKAGLEPTVFVINNLTSEGVTKSAETFAKLLSESQILFVPGGFSGGDEPDGSGKFITSFLRNPMISEQVHDLLDNRDGLACGICNGFQALIKLGLVPYGKITDPRDDAPTLTFNRIGRHQSRIVRTRVASNKSPWLMLTNPDEVYCVPISHGEGRFICTEEELKALAANGQIATQYVDLSGNPTMDIRCNPNGSLYAVEGITSPDGRVLGKMGHSERIGDGLYKNVEGNYDMKLFEAAKLYYKI